MKLTKFLLLSILTTLTVFAQKTTVNEFSAIDKKSIANSRLFDKKHKPNSKLCSIKLHNIEILLPREPIKFFEIKREWKTKIDFSIFSKEAINLLQKLIPENWIEEESIDHVLLSKVLDNNVKN